MTGAGDGTPGMRRPVWEDPRFEPVASRPRYDRMTDGEVLYLPVRGWQDDVLGFLWASVDGRAAGFVPRAAAGSAGLNAKAVWINRLLDARASGVTSVDALHQWIGEPGDDRSGLVPEGTVPARAEGTGALA